MAAKRLRGKDSSKSKAPPMRRLEKASDSGGSGCKGTSYSEKVLRLRHGNQMLVVLVKLMWSGLGGRKKAQS